MRYFLLKWILKVIIVASFFFIILRMFFIEGMEVISESMKPTLKINDHILVLKNKIFFGNPHFKRGEIITFLHPKNNKELLTKRIIGLPYEIITIKNNKIYINGKKLKEPYVIEVDYSLDEEKYPFQSIVIPEDSYFVMGDNRANSEDSRVWGPIPKEIIKGKVWLIYWPPWRISLLKN